MTGLPSGSPAASTATTATSGATAAAPGSVESGSAASTAVPAGAAFPTDSASTVAVSVGSVPATSTRSLTGDLLVRPQVGTAAGVPFVALPPTAVDGDPDGPVAIVAAWHGFDPPRTEAALSTAVPMTGVPAWRVYLRLPMPMGWPPPARDDLEAYAQTAERAAEVFPAALDEIRRELQAGEGPIGLAGISAGAGAALLTIADGAVPVAAAALVAPQVTPDLTARSAEVARGDAALLLVRGTADRIVKASDLTRFRERLQEAGMSTVEVATFRMGHELAAEPGTDAEPPTAAAVSVDGALTDWFREHLGVPIGEHLVGAATGTSP